MLRLVPEHAYSKSEGTICKVSYTHRHLRTVYIVHGYPHTWSHGQQFSVLLDPMKTEVRFAKVQPAPEYPTGPTVFKSSSGHRMSQRRCPRGHDLHPITTIALKKRLMEKVGKVLKESWRNLMSPSGTILAYFGPHASWLRGFVASWPSFEFKSSPKSCH